VYCGNPANTRDHVPPKLIYTKPFPDNLPTVPCCDSCNGAWSKDEQYFKIALSFMGGNIDLDGMHDEDRFTHKTLSNPKAFGLDDTILNSLGVDEFDRPYFSPDLQRLHRVLEKIAFGLCELRGWQTTGASFNTICLDRLSELLAGPTTADYLLAIFQKSQQTWNVVQPSVFEYILFRRADYASGTAYCALRFYSSIAAIVALDSLREVDWNGALVLQTNGFADT
jgi:hypothetical protein